MNNIKPSLQRKGGEDEPDYLKSQSQGYLNIVLKRKKKKSSN